MVENVRQAILSVQTSDNTHYQSSNPLRTTDNAQNHACKWPKNGSDNKESGNQQPIFTWAVDRNMGSSQYYVLSYVFVVLLRKPLVLKLAEHKRRQSDDD